MTTGNLEKLAALASRHKPLAVSHKPGEEKSEAALRKLSEKIGAAPMKAPRTTVLAGDTSSARCRTNTVCYKTLQSGLETSLQ